MSGVRRFEHATLRVTDLDAALTFYTGVLGLVELERRDGTVYLGCGLDDNYDLGLVEGGTGVEHVGIRAADEGAVEEYADRLRAAGAPVDRTGGDEPGQLAGVRTTLPSGVDLELVTVADEGYHHPAAADADRGGAAPRDVDHVNLLSYDVDADRAFLEDHLDFRTSDAIVGESGFTAQAWLRRGRYHHDVALSTADNVAHTLHHLSFEVSGFEATKALCDRVAAAGHDLELGPSRHNAGANTFAYLWTPGGNRVELTAEMATVDPGAEPTVRELDHAGDENTVSSWGGVVPTREFLEGGS